MKHPPLATPAAGRRLGCWRPAKGSAFNAHSGRRATAPRARNVGYWLPLLAGGSVVGQGMTRTAGAPTTELDMTERPYLCRNCHSCRTVTRVSSWSAPQHHPAMRNAFKAQNAGIVPPPPEAPPLLAF